MKCLTKMENGTYLVTTSKPTQYVITQESILNPLGKGAFGTVYTTKLYNSNSPTTYALKQISKSQLPDQRIQSEIQIMQQISKLSLYNLLPLIEWCEDEQYYYIILPFCDKGTLSSYIDKRKICDELNCIELFRQICYGLKMLHSQQIIHRDIKTDNILLTSYDNAQYPYQIYALISDYGLSKENHNNSLMTINVGTPLTRAPEVATSNYSFGSDIYSLGCIFYKMLTQKELLGGNNQNDILEAQKALSLLEVKSRFSLSELTLMVLEGCLQYDASCRITMEEISNLLQLESLYKDYKPLSIHAASETIIHLKEWKRKPNLINEADTEGKKKEEEEKENTIIIDDKKIIVQEQTIKEESIAKEENKNIKETQATEQSNENSHSVIKEEKHESIKETSHIEIVAQSTQVQAINETDAVQNTTKEKQIIVEDTKIDTQINKETNTNQDTKEKSIIIAAEENKEIEKQIKIEEKKEENKKELQTIEEIKLIEDKNKIEEEKIRQENAKKIEQQNAKEEEEKKIEAQRIKENEIKQIETQRINEETKKKEEEAKKIEEQRIKDEETKKIEEQRIKEEEEKKIKEKRIKEEEAKKKEEEEKEKEKNKREQEKQKLKDAFSQYQEYFNNKKKHFLKVKLWEEERRLCNY